MKLEVGKTYKNLAGQLVTIVRCSEDGYLFYDYKENEPKGFAYLANGEYLNCDRTSWDLLEL